MRDKAVRYALGVFIIVMTVGGLLLMLLIGRM